jgi:hypothetical protein
MAGKIELEVISSHFGRNVFSVIYTFFIHWQIAAEP